MVPVISFVTFTVFVAKMFFAFPRFAVFMSPVTRLLAVVSKPFRGFVRPPFCVAHLAIARMIAPIGGLRVRSIRKQHEPAKHRGREREGANPPFAMSCFRVFHVLSRVRARLGWAFGTLMKHCAWKNVAYC
jgi:hypothetical protein